MDVREYLKNNREINLSELARKMWPDNKDAESYLIRKINGQRPFTKKDAEKAARHLGELGIKLTGLTVADSYD